MSPPPFSADASPGITASTGAEQRHPSGLYLLFFTEMWERFSFYGLRAMLVFYMIKGLHFSQARSSNVYGWYSGLVYVTPILGGMLADRKFGYRRTIFFGGSLMAVGQFLLATEDFSLFYPGLACLAIGNGAFKPNISTLVGKLYPPGDSRRDSAFSIFYMGINVGAMLAPLVCGTLGERVSWGWGFFAAGVGMIIGLIIFRTGLRRHLGHINVDEPQPSPEISGAVAPTDPAERRQEFGRIASLFIISLFVVFFWAAYEQAGNTLALWADSNTVRDLSLPVLGTVNVPATWFQSVNSVFILLLAPILSEGWLMLARRGRAPSAPMKMAIGLFCLGLGFVVMVVAAEVAGSETGRVSMWWLIFAFCLHTIGELCLSPIGLSLVTKVAPARLAGMLMGVWFLANFGGNKIAGTLGELWERYPHTTFFSIFVVSSLGASALLFVMVRPLKKMMGGAV